MILTHKTGVLLHGTLVKDPVLKDVGQKQVLKFDVKAHSVKTGTGNRKGLYVQVNVWHGLDKWDGLLLKGDAVKAETVTDANGHFTVKVKRGGYTLRVQWPDASGQPVMRTVDFKAPNANLNVAA